VAIWVRRRSQVTSLANLYWFLKNDEVTGNRAELAHQQIGSSKSSKETPNLVLGKELGRRP
jgi:hypothetical protein